MKSPKTLLVIDDDPQLVKLVKTSLRQEGYHVLTGNDGSAALSLAHKHHPDAILMDVNMPTVNGLRAFQFLRADQKTSDIPIIFITEVISNVMEPFVQTVPRAAYLKKPLDLVELASFLKQFLNSQSQ